MVGRNDPTFRCVEVCEELQAKNLDRRNCDKPIGIAVKPVSERENSGKSFIVHH